MSDIEQSWLRITDDDLAEMERAHHRKHGKPKGKAVDPCICPECQEIDCECDTDVPRLIAALRAERTLADGRLETLRHVNHSADRRRIAELEAEVERLKERNETLLRGNRSMWMELYGGPIP